MSKRALVLGAGLISAAVLEYLAEDCSIDVTVAALEERDLKKVQKICPRFTTVHLDFTRDIEERDGLVSATDVIISLVPNFLNAEAAKVCLKYKKSLVTANVISPDIQQLHERVAAENVTFLFEMGLDPGIDHMLAMKTFNDIRFRGGKVIKYELWCGGLPAPEFATNPLRYKFSWNPKIALGSSLREARVLKDGEMLILQEGSPILAEVKDADFFPEFDLESFPIFFDPSLLSSYKIESARDVIKGSLRYKGFNNAVYGLMQLGLLEDKPDKDLLKDGSNITWKAYISSLLGHSEDLSDDKLRNAVLEAVGGNDERVQAIEDLGLLRSTPVNNRGTPLDTLLASLETPLSYGPDETDVVLMHLEIVGKYPDSSKEKRRIDMVMRGDVGGHSAMAKTVGYTVGIAARMLLEGKIKEKGVLLPISADIYTPVLWALKERGIEAEEAKY